MRNVLNAPGRFGTQAALAASTDPRRVHPVPAANGFGTLQNASQFQPQFGVTFSGQLTRSSSASSPIPATWRDAGGSRGSSR